VVGAGADWAATADAIASGAKAAENRNNFIINSL